MPKDNIRPDENKSFRHGRLCATKNVFIMPKKFTLFDCQQIAKTKGGKCLSTDYKNTKSELKWECSKGHTWFAPLGNIKDKRLVI